MSLAPRPAAAHRGGIRSSPGAVPSPAWLRSWKGPFLVSSGESICIWGRRELAPRSLRVLPHSLPLRPARAATLRNQARGGARTHRVIHRSHRQDFRLPTRRANYESGWKGWVLDF